MEVEVYFDEVGVCGKLGDEDVCFLDFVLELVVMVRMEFNDVVDVMSGLIGGLGWGCVLYVGIVEGGERIGGFRGWGGVELEFGREVVDDGFGGEEVVVEEELLVGLGEG